MYLKSYGKGSKSDKPYFENVYPRNVTTFIDDTAILKCVVKNKGDRTVSLKKIIIIFFKP